MLLLTIALIILLRVDCAVVILIGITLVLELVLPTLTHVLGPCRPAVHEMKVAILYAHGPHQFDSTDICCRGSQKIGMSHNLHHTSGTTETISARAHLIVH